jgi:hypothetical protein
MLSKTRRAVGHPITPQSMQVILHDQKLQAKLKTHCKLRHNGKSSDTSELEPKAGGGWLFEEPRTSGPSQTPEPQVALVNRE